MTFILMVAVACCAFASACGEAVRVYGEAGGVVRMPGVSAHFYPHVFNLEWGGGSAQGGLLPGISFSEILPWMYLNCCKASFFSLWPRTNRQMQSSRLLE